MTDGPFEFAYLLNERLQRNGRSPTWLAQQLNVSLETVNDWLNGRALPPQETIVQIMTLLPNAAPINRTEIYGDIYGPVHTGSGDINVNPLSLAALQDWLKHIFRWSEVDEHMRSSWAGMVLWLLSVIIDQINPAGVFVFLVALALWLAASWLMLPILQWPLSDAVTRLTACIQYAAAALLLPLLIGSLTQADNQTLFQLESHKEKMTLWFLKMTGALVGFNTFSLLLVLLVLALYHLNLTHLPTWMGRMLVLLPLLFSHITARRIPADRYKMFNGRLQLHEADRLFFVVFLLLGPLVAGFVYFGYAYLVDQVVGTALLVTLIGVTWWQMRKTAVSP